MGGTNETEGDMSPAKLCIRGKEVGEIYAAGSFNVVCIFSVYTGFGDYLPDYC